MFRYSAGYSSASASSAIAFMVIAILASIAAVVLAFIFIIPESKRPKLNTFGKILHDLLNFKYLVIEKILQALYIFTTAFVIIYGFFSMFTAGASGLIVMILGPVIIRIAYEAFMMFILLVKNTIAINNKIKNQNEGDPNASGFDIPKYDFKPAAPVAPVAPAAPAAPVAPAAPAAPAANICPNCGANVGDAAFCVKCGTKVK